MLILACLTISKAQSLQDGFYISTKCKTASSVKRVNLLNVKQNFCLLLQPFQPLTEIVDVSKITYASNVIFFDITISQKVADQIFEIHKNIKNGNVAVVVADELMFVIPPEVIPSSRRIVRIASTSATATAVHEKLTARMTEIKNTPHN